MQKIMSVLMLTVLLFVGLLLGVGVGSRFEMWDSGTAKHVEDVGGPFLPASGSAEVRFDPDKYTFIVERVDVGYRFNVTVELFDAVELMAWQVRVYFNNTILNATNAYYHPNEPIHAVNHMPLSPVIKNDYNSTHGYAQHGISATYPNYVNVTAGNYPEGIGICIMEFEVIAKPSGGKYFESDLTLNNANTYLIWKDGSTEISCEKRNGWYCLKDPIKVPTDYSTIQAAINALDPTVIEPIKNALFIWNGTYYENVMVNKTLMLFGESRESVIVNGSGGTTLYVDNIRDVTIDGLTVTSGSNGIYVYSSGGAGSSGLKIFNNNIIANGDCGIYAHVYSPWGSWSYMQCNDLMISGNNISANRNHGIYTRCRKAGGISGSAAINDCDNWIIFINNISANGGHGIYADVGGPDAYGFKNYVGGMSCDSWLVSGNNISSNAGCGIHANTDYNGYSEYWTISDNNIAECNAAGIYACSSDSRSSLKNWTASDNRIVGNMHGIMPGGTSATSDFSILNNTIESNRQYGIYLNIGSHILRGNKMNNNTYNFGVVDSYFQDVDTSNILDGKPIYYWINKHAGQVPANAGYVALVNSTNIIVEDCNVSHNWQGMLLVRTENITLENIHLTENMYGIYLQQSSDFTAYSSQTVNNVYGIYLQGSANGTLSCNKAINNTYGIYFLGSANCTLDSNTMTENDYGIYLSGSSNNKIFHNNFKQNNQQAATDGSVANIWDNGYPSGGNHWSDYTGPDEQSSICQNETGSDGIVDSNYTISQNNVDFYPLSAPWSSPLRIILPGNTTYRGTNITALTPRQTMNLTFTLDFNASWIGYSLDGQVNVTITGNTTLADLSYGLHHIVVYANDTSGNMHSSAKVYFTITFLTDLNYDRTVDVKDLAMTCYAYGSVLGDPRWRCKLDFNRDNIVDIEDIALVAADYGKSWP